MAFSSVVAAATSMISRGDSSYSNAYNIIQAGLGIAQSQVLREPGWGREAAAFMRNQPLDALAGILARPDPALSFMWYVELPPLLVDGGLVTLPWYYVEEATVPFRNFETRSVYREGRTKTVAGKYTVDSLSLGIYLDEEGVALSYFQAWESLILAPFSSQEKARGGGFRLPSRYHLPVHIFLLDAMRMEVVRVTAVECWRQSLDTLQLQSAASDRLIGRVTLNVGDVFMESMKLNPTQFNNVLQRFAQI